MNRFPAIDLAGALRLTRQGRLKEAIATLRGKRANAKLPPRVSRYPRPADPGATEIMDAALFLKGPAQPVEYERPQPPPEGARFEERSYSNAVGSRNISSSFRVAMKAWQSRLWSCCTAASSRLMISPQELE